MYGCTNCRICPTGEQQRHSTISNLLQFCVDHSLDWPLCLHCCRRLLLGFRLPLLFLLELAAHPVFVGLFALLRGSSLPGLPLRLLLLPLPPLLLQCHTTAIRVWSLVCKVWSMVFYCVSRYSAAAAASPPAAPLHTEMFGQ